MFGYIKPYKPFLRICDWEIYRGIYCSVCRIMGKKFGILSRFILSYDSCFLVALILAIQDKNVEFKKGRCVFNPLKRCSFCISNNDLFEFTGAVAIILSYYKIQDNINDSSFLRGIFMKIAKGFIYHPYRKAVKYIPEVENIIKEYMERQYTEEKNPDYNIDRVSAPTSEMMSSIFKSCILDEGQSRIMSSIGYFTGRWIYILDAIDDIDEDLKNNNYNPFLCRNLNISHSDLYKYADGLLNQTYTQITSAYNLLEINRFSEMLDNIIFTGFPDIQRQILIRKVGREEYEKSV